MPVLLPLLELACGLPVTHPWSRSGLYSTEPVSCSPRAIADWVAYACDASSASSPSSPPDATAPGMPSALAAVSEPASPIAEPPTPAAPAHEPEPEPEPEPEHKPVTRGESGASSVAVDEAEVAEAADACTSAFEQLRRELGLVSYANALAAADNAALKREARVSLANGEASFGLAGGRMGSERLSPLAEFLLLVDSYLVDNPANVAQVVHTRFFELLALLMHKVCCSTIVFFCLREVAQHSLYYDLWRLSVR